MGATAELAAWASSFRPSAIPASAPVLLLDWLGNAIGGVRGESSAAMARFLDRRAPRGESIAIGRDERLDAPWAALWNGQSSHVLECDDTHQGSSSHPGAATWSAVLALAEREDATLGDAMVAAVVGYELVGRLGEALGPAEHYARGFHPTGTCGTIGCAAAASRLLRLDERATANAIGIATSQAAGSMEFLADGAWTKRLHPGWAAHAGLVAADLAAAGFTGPATALEGRSGFLASHSAGPRVERLVDGLGRDLVIDRTSIKAHACCRYEQAPIDALLALRREHGLRAQHVDLVRIGMLAAGWDIVAEPRARKTAPESVVDAQFSMPFGAACAIVRGRASIHEHVPATLADPEIRALMARVECFRDPELDARYPRQWPCRVEVRTRDGRVLHARVDHPRGDPENPLSRDERVAKVRDLAGDVLPAGRLDAIVAAVEGNPSSLRARDLGRLLRGER
ncbi:MAG: MmgE/PrpD family protein [Alphaproteobacteria bacterium]